MAALKLNRHCSGISVSPGTAVGMMNGSSERERSHCPPFRGVFVRWQAHKMGTWTLNSIGHLLAPRWLHRITSRVCFLFLESAAPHLNNPYPLRRELLKRTPPGLVQHFISLWWTAVHICIPVSAAISVWNATLLQYAGGLSWDAGPTWRVRVPPMTNRGESPVIREGDTVAVLLEEKPSQLHGRTEGWQSGNCKSLILTWLIMN